MLISVSSPPPPLCCQAFQESICHCLQKYCLNYSTALLYLDSLKPREDFGSYVKVLDGVRSQDLPQCRGSEMKSDRCTFLEEENSIVLDQVTGVFKVMLSVLKLFKNYEDKEEVVLFSAMLRG